MKTIIIILVVGICGFVSYAYYQDTYIFLPRNVLNIGNELPEGINVIDSESSGFVNFKDSWVLDIKNKNIAALLNGHEYSKCNIKPEKIHSNSSTTGLKNHKEFILNECYSYFGTGEVNSYLEVYINNERNRVLVEYYTE